MSSESHGAAVSRVSIRAVALRRVPVRTLLVAALSLSMALAAATLMWWEASDGPLVETGWLEWWMLIPVFAVTEVFVVHLYSGNSAHTHTLREVPSVVALSLLSPLGYLF